MRFNQQLVPTTLSPFPLSPLVLLEICFFLRFNQNIGSTTLTFSINRHGSIIDFLSSLLWNLVDRALSQLIK